MNRDEKAEVVASLRTSLDGVSAVILASSVGMSVNAINELRTALRQIGAKYIVVKNTLARLAIEGTDLETLQGALVGQTALIFHPEDGALAAKTVVAFKKTNDGFQLRGVWLNGTIMPESGVEVLSKMPGKDELRAQLLSVFQAPATQMVRVLAASPTSFLNVLNARKDSLAA